MRDAQPEELGVISATTDVFPRPRNHRSSIARLTLDDGYENLTSFFENCSIASVIVP
jgi:hypothetical protein